MRLDFESSHIPKDGSAMRSLLNGARRIKEISAYNSEYENSNRSKGALPWGAYATDMSAYFDYPLGSTNMLISVPLEERTIRELVQQTHVVGRKAVALDVFGEASGSDLGFDQTITVSLTADETPKSDIAITGNALELKTRQKLKVALDHMEGELVFVHCNPVGGLMDTVRMGDGSQSLYSVLQLERLFDIVYKKLASPGYIALAIGHTLTPQMVDLFLAKLEKEKINFELTSKYREGILIKK